MSAETIRKLNAFIDSLPAEARSKCALCNETLTHIVKQAEARTGAGTATVTRELADRLNDGAAPGDRVSEEALKKRVQRHEGIIRTKRPDKCTNRADNPEPAKPETGEPEPVSDPPEKPRSHVTEEKPVAVDPEPEKPEPPEPQAYGKHWAIVAISQLSRIPGDDPERQAGFDMVIRWINDNR